MYTHMWCTYMRRLQSSATRSAGRDGRRRDMGARARGPAAEQNCNGESNCRETVDPHEAVVVSVGGTGSGRVTRPRRDGQHDDGFADSRNWMRAAAFRSYGVARTPSRVAHVRATHTYSAYRAMLSDCGSHEVPFTPSVAGAVRLSQVSH